MMHRLLLIAVCAAAVLTAADDSLVVRSDLSGMVDKYLTQIAERDWRARDEALAAIHDAARRSRSPEVHPRNHPE